ncbi:hypothetical protein AX15_003640 [Amanita polypyramis BW_CC]|nr:hypothetical protein AX15_003640 [Amanita polypyramis BW_CC]
MCLSVDIAEGYPIPELKNVSLFGTGSRFPAHKGTQEQGGTFDTMMLILPSAHYTFQMAWRAELSYGSKCIRMYNLIHPLSGSPALTAPYATTTKLRGILHQRRTVAFEETLKHSMITYLLQSSYPMRELLEGTGGLKGEDAHEVSKIRAVENTNGIPTYESSEIKLSRSSKETIKDEKKKT